VKYSQINYLYTSCTCSDGQKLFIGDYVVSRMSYFLGQRDITYLTFALSRMSYLHLAVLVELN
jgi:hypothetical protein